MAELVVELVVNNPKPQVICAPPPAHHLQRNDDDGYMSPGKQLELISALHSSTNTKIGCNIRSACTCKDPSEAITQI